MLKKKEPRCGSLSAESRRGNAWRFRTQIYNFLGKNEAFGAGKQHIILNISRKLVNISILCLDINFRIPLKIIKTDTNELII